MAAGEQSERFLNPRQVTVEIILEQNCVLLFIFYFPALVRKEG